jgi:hypothetical protein
MVLPSSASSRRSKSQNCTTTHDGVGGVRMKKEDDGINTVDRDILSKRKEDEAQRDK